MINNALILLFGWFLGLVSSEINDWRKRIREAEDFRRGIENELDEAKIRLVMLAYKMAGRSKTINNEFLSWIRPHMENYHGNYPTDSISELLGALAELSDQQLQTLYDQKNEQGRSMSVKVFSLPYLDSRISILSSLKNSVQKRIIEIRAQVGILNELIDEARFYHDKTFDSNLSPENHSIVQVNIEQCYNFIGNQARRLVDDIDDASTEL